MSTRQILALGNKFVVDTFHLQRIGMQTQQVQRRVNTVFQSYALFSHMTVADNVGFPLKMAGENDRAPKKRNALELVEMAEFASRYPHQMSGGQRQRVALARAIVNRPPVLLLDEPLGALDLRLRQQMQHVLVELQRELGITFIHVTHDQSEALSMSDRVAVIDKGRIRQLGSPQDLYFSPTDEFVARFIGKSNNMDIDVTMGGNTRFGIRAGRRFPLSRNAPIGKARLSLRFECIDIIPQKTRTKKSVVLNGVVSDVLFLGNVFEVKAKTPVGEIFAYAAAGGDAALVSGMEVNVCFNPGDGSVFGASA